MCILLAQVYLPDAVAHVRLIPDLVVVHCLNSIFCRGRASPLLITLGVGRGFAWLNAVGSCSGKTKDILGVSGRDLDL